MKDKYRVKYRCDMQNRPYRFIPVIMLFIGALACFSTLLPSCSKESKTSSPGISIIRDSGYVSHDTMLVTGQKIKVGIHAISENANLTYFSIRFNDGATTTLLDTGINSSSLVYNLDIIKTNAPTEKWTFLVMDRNRNKDSVSIILEKSSISKWGKIRTISDVVLGAQENQTTGSFYSLEDELVMNLEEAFGQQLRVDLVFYYGQYEGTLASPNEAEAPGFFTGPMGIASWTIKNETRYDTTMIAPAMFDGSVNDSLILAAYEPAAGKKKGKFVQPGMVFSFRSPAGKLGLMKIAETTPLPAGDVRLTIKIQE
jgi:hypothetical protein